jgi:predicted permease
MTVLAITNNGMWGIALIIGLVAALIVAALLLVLVRAVRDIDSSATSLLDVAGKVAGNTANIPQLQATAPVLALIVDEAVIQDGYMNALTDGYGRVPA